MFYKTASKLTAVFEIPKFFVIGSISFQSREKRFLCPPINRKVSDAVLEGHGIRNCSHVKLRIYLGRERKVKINSVFLEVRSIRFYSNTPFSDSKSVAVKHRKAFRI